MLAIFDSDMMLYQYSIESVDVSEVVKSKPIPSVSLPSEDMKDDVCSEMGMYSLERNLCPPEYTTECKITGRYRPFPRILTAWPLKTLLGRKQCPDTIHPSYVCMIYGYYVQYKSKIVFLSYLFILTKNLVFFSDSSCSSFDHFSNANTLAR